MDYIELWLWVLEEDLWLNLSIQMLPKLMATVVNSETDSDSNWTSQNPLKDM